ncbi:hypothetical protein GO685_05040 [Wolbachia endosymbiont of Madathamugadia hiepei]|uniref:hypothetical protein n=1 Tax=Wolbachia endosymbiont of Madathamugadia hiepei TaxID=1241303 RepID=UPI001589B71C|nr:hypothetical protein [Wolbachia endosymbiont of Madathamugadia hiepei]NUX01817.1 hypothetical protein [Wolbachia endosymbiont of Madathamugadia hiepei]
MDLAKNESVKKLLEEAESKRVANRKNDSSTLDNPNNKPCADEANIPHSTKGNKLPIITASAGLLLGLSIAYLAVAAALTPVGAAIAVFLAAAAVGALVGYGAGRFCQRVSEEKQEDPDLSTWDAVKSVFSDVFTTGHSKEREV